MDTNENKPCLVQTGQGFSVEYKGKLLYSKYNPSKTIVSTIEKLNILPKTLILCLSPVLDYGIKELLAKIEDNFLESSILIIEKEEELLELERQWIDNFNSEKIHLISASESQNYIENFYRNFNGEFKRVIKIDFSAASLLNRDFYEKTFENFQNIINQYWKNRITLVKFGKKYSKNLFKNLKILQKSGSFPKVSKAILLLGAGESAVKTLEEIKKKGLRENFYIIAVDALLKSLKALKITADAAVCEECQTIIAQAFTGCSHCYRKLFLSITANTSLSYKNTEKNIFYTPIYTNCNFLKRLTDEKILSETFEPLGSVGLSALNIALKIRKDENIPIFVSGLDFSFSKNRTHSSSSFHDQEKLKKINRLTTIERFDAAFSEFSKKIENKRNPEIYYTNPSLENYALLFIDRFSKIKNIYNLSNSGFDLKIPLISLEEALSSKNALDIEENDENFQEVLNKEKALKVEKFLEEEKNSLLLLKDILTGRKKLSKEEGEKEILEILSKREYLFLHFPDGQKARYSLDFLKRVRAEIDSFLKIF